MGAKFFSETRARLYKATCREIPEDKYFHSETNRIIERVKKVKLKAICRSYSTAALRHIVLLPKLLPSFISRGAAHTKRR